MDRPTDKSGHFIGPTPGCSAWTPSIYDNTSHTVSMTFLLIPLRHLYKQTRILIMNTDDYNHLKKNGVITFDLTDNMTPSLKRSPRAMDCWWAEHQYGVHYTLHEEDGDRLYFHVTSPDEVEPVRPGGG